MVEAQDQRERLHNALIGSGVTMEEDTKIPQGLVFEALYGKVKPVDFWQEMNAISLLNCVCQGFEVECNLEKDEVYYKLIKPLHDPVHSEDILVNLNTELVRSHAPVRE